MRRKIYDLAGGRGHGVSQDGVSLSTHSGFTRALGFEGEPGLFESDHVLLLLIYININIY